MSNENSNVVNVIIDKETFKRLSKVGEKKNSSAVTEISKALEKHLEDEEGKPLVKESKQYLTEGN